jgi:hypothetical protein
MPSSSLLDGVSFVASRVSARRPTYLCRNALCAFSLPRQWRALHAVLTYFAKQSYVSTNVSQRKATRVRVSLRCAKGNLRCSQQAGSLQTRFAQTCNLLHPPVAALLGTRTREGEETSPRFASVGGESGSPLSLRWCKAPAAAPGIPAPVPHPCVCAEQRSEARIKRAACLSPQGEFAARLRFASSAGCPGAQHRGRRHQGRLSLAYVSLAKQRKVSRPPGRDPARNASQHFTK